MTFKLTNFPPKKIMNTVTCLVARAVESYCPLCNTMSLLQHNFQFSKCIIQVIWIIFQFLGTCKAKIAFTYGNVVNDPFDQAVGFEIDLQSRAKLDETVENLEKNAINEEKRKKKMDLPPSPPKQCWDICY